MRTFYILLVVTSFFQFGLSQLKFEKTSHDFGNLDSDSERFIDIEVKNTGSKKEYFLSFRKPNQVVCLSNGQRIDPDSTLFIRIQANPKSLGRFNYDIEIYTSDKQHATIIRVKGNLISLPNDPLAKLQSCPDFNIRPAKAKLSSKQELITRDEKTLEPISALVYVIQNGQEIQQVPTYAKKEKVKIPIGMTHFYVVSEGYEPLDTALFVGMKSKLIILELRKRKVKTKIIVDTIIKEVTAELPPAKKSLKQELQLEEATNGEDRSPKKMAELTPSNFDSEHFMPVNVVFVVDISGSMQTSDKSNLMKYALNQLVDMLRPEDKMGIVTFATTSELLLSADEKLNKEETKNMISGLKSGGSTAGVAGLKKGLEEVEKQYLDQGKNMLIVITDGSFDLNKQGKKIVAKAGEKNISLSIVGIKTGPTTAQQLEETAKKSGGDFILIKRLVDAQHNLTEEIRRKSFKGL